MNYQDLVTAIQETIKPNNDQAITGQSLRDVLLAIVAWAEEQEETTRDVLTTSIAPQLNIHTGQIATIEDNIQALADSKATKVELANAVTVTKEYAEDVADERAESKAEAAYDRAIDTSEAYTNRVIAERVPWTSVVSLDNGESDDVDIMQNVFYIFENPITGELVVNENPTATTMQGLEALTFGFQFETGATAPTVNMPETWRFPEVPTIEPNFTYQVSVVNSLALIVGWPNS